MLYHAATIAAIIKGVAHHVKFLANARCAVKIRASATTARASATTTRASATATRASATTVPASEGRVAVAARKREGATFWRLRRSYTHI